MKLVWRWVVPITMDPAQGYLRADQAIHQALQAREGTWSGFTEADRDPPVFSRSKVSRLIESGAIRASSLELKPSTKLQPGVQVEIELEPEEPSKLLPEDIPLDILYEDEHLAIINKPAGMVVHPSSGHARSTLVHAILFHIKNLSSDPLRPGIVHRLDRDTSGALVITKTDAAQLGMAKLFETHDLERTYWALCYGSPQWKQEKRIETLFGRNPKDRKKMSAEVTKGKKAITRFQKLESYARHGKPPFASLLEAKLETGKTHQVRVHLTLLGHSILGDPVYGTPTSQQTKWKQLPPSVREMVQALPGQALHARTVSFKHPVSGDLLKIEAPPPASFQELLDLLRGSHGD